MSPAGGRGERGAQPPRAFFLLGEDALATHHFESVLAGDPPAPVAANVRRFLAEMRARGRWRRTLGLAVAPDSNIGATTDERILYIDVLGSTLPFRYDAQATSGVGVSLWGGRSIRRSIRRR